MATARKLPSGSWRARVYSHKENGKKVYKSFTAPSKREAELLAAQFKNGIKVSADNSKTIIEAVKGYINAKEGVLSPSTVRGYDRMVKYYKPIEHYKLYQFSNEKAQIFISDLSKTLSPKTVSNIFGLLTSSIGLYCPDMRLKVTLPTNIPSQKNAPSDEDIQALFNTAPKTLKICIALSAFGSLRRGEVCALKYGDIENNIVYVRADIVKDRNGEWIYKAPKTPDSIRKVVALPDEVIDLIGEGEEDEFIIKWTPDSVTKRFIDLKKSLNIDNIRYHDLRSYFASIGVALGIPDIYLADYGGWTHNSKILKSAYQKKIVSISEAYSNRMKSHFSDLIKKV